MGKEKQSSIKVFINYQLTHYGLVDINKLFVAIPKWFNDFKYDFWETGMGQKDIGIGKQYASDWKAFREINDYVKFEIVMKVFLKNINKIEVDGEKLFKCDAEIYFDSQMTKNYKGTFGKDKFQETLRQIYERYVRYQDLLDYEDKLAKECVDLMNIIKSHLK